MRRKIKQKPKLDVIVALLFGFVFTSILLFSQQPQSILHPRTKKILKLYPEIHDRSPGIPSPFTTENGVEIIVGVKKDKTYTLIPVTQRKGEPWIPDKGLWGIGNQLHVDAEDFPTLARTGLHSQIELDRTKSITGRSVSEITEEGRPGRSSGAGFMSHDEDIISVLKGDNGLVKKMGLTHPQMAKPLFHVWNLLGKVGHEIAEDYECILYNGKKVHIQALRLKPGQLSLFNDGYRGGSDIDIWRELEKSEEEFLRKRYSGLTEIQFNELIEKLSRMHTGELEAYYIMHYGFYEGHTEYRTDPVAIAFVFGLRSLEEIEAAFPGKIFKVLTTHFVRKVKLKEAEYE
ncbi:MAG: hypothetical protein PVI11_08075 [Candidatus Aminicenantes bacterium]|jgi:hypothetical protein